MEAQIKGKATLTDLLADVPAEWHEAFRQFVETGDAGQPFLDYLDRDPKGQRAIEQAFSAQSDALEALGQHIRSAPPAQASSAAAPREAASQAVAAALEQVLALPGKERRASLADAVEQIARLKRGSVPKALEAVVSDFRDVVEKSKE